MLSSVPPTPLPPVPSVTILLFNSSRRSLVLVKQFRPGEVGGGEAGGLTFSTLGSWGQRADLGGGSGRNSPGRGSGQSGSRGAGHHRP